MTDMQERPCRGRIAITLGVGIASALSIAAAVFQTRTEWFKTSDTTGRVHLYLVYSVLLLLPVAVLLFALGVQWALRRKRLLAALALVALPVWAECLLRMDGILANDLYVAFVFAQLNGMKPFGGP